jgi:hypothetical protein
MLQVSARLGETVHEFIGSSLFSVESGGKEEA